MKFRKSLSPIFLTLLLSGGLLLTGCDDHKTDTAANPKSVNVKVFETSPLTYTIKMALPARVVASQVAEIRPQVNGIILKREFEESSDVTEGQSLYEIDPAIYQAAYDSAVASVASAKASANIAHLTLQRYAGLLKTKSISQQDYDKAAADAQTADANVLVAQANYNTAKVNLNYTKVYSPIDGYIGKSNVTEGALVSAAQTNPLALVQTLDPIYVDMTLAATRYESYLKNRNVLFEPEDSVEILLNDNSKYQHKGFIKFSDKNVSQTTGTVMLRAEFANPDGAILPGMFLKPQWTLGKIDQAILVPQKGITSDQAGNYTAIVAIPLPDSEQKANASGESKEQQYYFQKRNNVKVYDGVTGYWIVTEGINAGERVVISGLLNLSSLNLNNPDSKVLANIIDTPESLSQEQLDKIIESNLK